jgi:DNA-3-methyladenine glycosylase I
MKRCSWAGNDPLYIDYHDKEWGLPVYDERKMFEFMILEGMQAGLSWITVLRKRDHFREAFDHFDPMKIANYDEKKYQELMNNSGIIRNKLKIRSAITNAQLYLKLFDKSTLVDYFWSFTNGKVVQNSWKDMSEVPATTDLSDKISKDLKQKGFKFIGSTVIYAHLQASGIVNDHVIDCFRHKELCT